ncbi:uncharacterized protein [Haliotis asinina]|uniref:uncharacterized protein n=1 Tax=Haliotis asinina TaxID=109174 RepID=UPI0035319C2C
MHNYRQQHVVSVNVLLMWDPVRGLVAAAVWLLLVWQSTCGNVYPERIQNDNQHNVTMVARHYDAVNGTAWTCGIPILSTIRNMVVIQVLEPTVGYVERSLSPANLQELERCLLEEWQHITPNVITRLTCTIGPPFLRSQDYPNLEVVEASPNSFTLRCIKTGGWFTKLITVYWYRNDTLVFETYRWISPSVTILDNTFTNVQLTGRWRSHTVTVSDVHEGVATWRCNNHNNKNTWSNPVDLSSYTAGVTSFTLSTPKPLKENSTRPDVMDVTQNDNQHNVTMVASHYDAVNGTAWTCGIPILSTISNMVLIQVLKPTGRQSVEDRTQLYTSTGSTVGVVVLTVIVSVIIFIIRNRKTAGEITGVFPIL